MLYHSIICHIFTGNQVKNTKYWTAQRFTSKQLSRKGEITPTFFSIFHLNFYFRLKKKMFIFNLILSFQLPLLCGKKQHAVFSFSNPQALNLEFYFFMAFIWYTRIFCNLPRDRALNNFLFICQFLSVSVLKRLLNSEQRRCHVKFPDWFQIGSSTSALVCSEGNQIK